MTPPLSTPGLAALLAILAVLWILVSLSGCVAVGAFIGSKIGHSLKGHTSTTVCDVNQLTGQQTCRTVSS